MKSDELLQVFFLYLGMLKDHYDYCVEHMGLGKRACARLALHHPEVIEEHYYWKEELEVGKDGWGSV